MIHLDRWIHEPETATEVGVVGYPPGNDQISQGKPENHRLNRGRRGWDMSDSFEEFESSQSKKKKETPTWNWGSSTTFLHKTYGAETKLHVLVLGAGFDPLID